MANTARRSRSERNDPRYHPKTAFDLLEIPLLGRALKSRQGRLILQLPFFVAAVLLVYDGFTGPDVASRNLATVAPWVHYRGLVVVALLLAGNLFCMGCPFTLPRTLARKLSISGRRFPRVLRNKWLAIAGLFGMFFLYEWLNLWQSPALTAWVIVAYFVASFVLEAAFRESPFCKYVCPLGSFNFVYSTTSPTQIAVKDTDVCASCQGKECVNGSWSAQPVIRVDAIPVQRNGEIVTEKREVRQDTKGVLGCGTELFPPQLSSNLDCIYCLDCARACPHDNIGLMTRTPGRELSQSGAWPARWDVSLFVITLAFMGMSNAFGMVPPVYELQAWLAETLQIRSEFLFLGGLFLLMNILLPIGSALLAGYLTQLFTSTRKKFSLRDTVAAFAPAFVPIGFGIWFAHYGFHFLIAPLSIVPVIREFLGLPGLWQQYSWTMPDNIIGLIQVVAMVGGFLWSMVIAQRVALERYRRDAVPGMLPWAFLLLLMMLLSIYVFSLPMEMRGTGFMIG